MGMKAIKENALESNLDDAVEFISASPVLTLIKWLGYTNLMLDNYRKKKVLSCQYAEKLKTNGIDCYVLNGLRISSFYSDPKRRPLGDFDYSFMLFCLFAYKQLVCFRQGKRSWYEDGGSCGNDKLQVHLNSTSEFVDKKNRYIYFR